MRSGGGDVRLAIAVPEKSGWARPAKTPYIVGAGGRDMLRESGLIES